MLYACAFDQQAALDRERQATAWLGDKLRGERQAHAEILRANAARDATALAAAPVLAAAPALAAAPSATREGATHRLLHQRLAPGFRSRALGAANIDWIRGVVWKRINLRVHRCRCSRR